MYIYKSLELRFSKIQIQQYLWINFRYQQKNYKSMKYLSTILSSLILLSLTLSSCDDIEETSSRYQINDSILGIFGSVNVFDEYGEMVSYADVNVCAQRIQDLDGNATNDSIIAKTNDLGSFDFIKCLGGTYNISFSKDGFESNFIYQFQHDTLDADTLPTIRLSKKTLAKISITDFYYDTIHFEIGRRIDFTGSTSDEYYVTCHYFFDTTENVSSDNYVGHFISGAIKGFGNTSNEYRVQKTHNFVINSNEAINVGHEIYICAYPENYKFYQYTDNNGKEHFPTLGEKSNIVHYTLDSLMFPH